MPLDKALSRVLARVATLATGDRLMASPLRYRWFDHVFSPACTLGDTDRLVAAALFRHMSAAGSCYPSATTIAGQCGKSERTIWRAVDRLQKAGLLTIPTKRPIVRNGAGMNVNVYQAVLPPPPETNHHDTAMSRSSENHHDTGDQITMTDRADHHDTAMSYKPTNRTYQGTGRAKARKTVSKDGEREEWWTQAVDDLVNRRRYPSHLTGDQLLPVMAELSISTYGVDERQARSAIEERRERLRAGETLGNLAEKKGGGGNGSVDYVTRRLMFEFPENAPEVKAELVEKFGTRAFASAWVRVQHERDDKFYPAMMAELEESGEVAT